MVGFKAPICSTLISLLEGVIRLNLPKMLPFPFLLSLLLTSFLLPYSHPGFPLFFSKYCLSSFSSPWLAILFIFPGPF